MSDPLKDLLDAIPEIEDIQVRSKFIIISARLNRDRATKKHVLGVIGGVLEDVRLNVAVMKHDLEATRRERDALKNN